MLKERFNSAVILAVVVTACLAGGLYSLSQDKCSETYRNDTSLKSGIKLEKVTSEQDHLKGLSGRECINSDQGMVFVFDTPGQQCMWMKDMKFAIDMVWLDKAAKVLKLEENVNPYSYPKSFCTEGEASYVIETDAGRARAYGFTPGAQLEL